MTFSAFLVGLRNNAKQGANRNAQQVQRPVQKQTQWAASTEAAKKGPPKHAPTIRDEVASDFLILDVSLGRL